MCGRVGVFFAIYIFIHACVSVSVSVSVYVYICSNFFFLLYICSVGTRVGVVVVME